MNDDKGGVIVKILNNRFSRFVIACISLLLLFNSIQESYAKYVSSATANSSFTIAQWAFTVNSQDVLNNSDFSNTITPVFTNNPNVADGTIAPNSEGYFDLVINAQNVGVSFTQTISLTRGTTNTVSDLVFTGYSLNGGSINTFTNQTTPTITTDIELTNTTRVNTYRIYVRWIDGTGENMNNAADTTAAKTGVANVATNIQFIQKASQS
jgi:hypothetical protein